MSRFPHRQLGHGAAGVEGNPDMRKANTSYVERSNLTMRMSMRRFTRLTNAFSRRWRSTSPCSACTSCTNFCRNHKTLRVTPAMEAGLSDTFRDTARIVGLIEARAPKPRRPKKYRKRKEP